MIPWSRSKRKYAKAGEADTVDETNYGAPIEETSFTQVFSSFFGYYFQSHHHNDHHRILVRTRLMRDRTLANTVSMINDTIKRHEKCIALKILHRIKLLKIAAVMQAPLIIVMVVMLFGYPKLLFGDPCLSVNLTTTLMNSTALPTAPVTFNTTTLGKLLKTTRSKLILYAVMPIYTSVIWGTSSEFITEALLTDTNGDMTSVQLGELGGRSAWSYCSLTFENAIYFLG